VKDPDLDVELGTWQIREPKPDRCAPVGSDVIDFVLVPGVAFDVRGGRLGYGGGFYDKLYDKLLAGPWSTRPWLVAGAFEVQIVEEMPLDTHDVVMDVIITESMHYFCEPR
jgi:5-formyltetrahydrofolate cyclo-ligase